MVGGGGVKRTIGKIIYETAGSWEEGTLLEEGGVGRLF